MENENENTKPVKKHTDDAAHYDSKGFADDTKYTSPDKYLAAEQKGVSYTDQGHPESNSDNFEFSNQETSEKFKPGQQNSYNAEAFNQDEYILKDNIDLDEDQSQSISSEIDIDTNTTDEV